MQVLLFMLVVPLSSNSFSPAFMTPGHDIFNFKFSKTAMGIKSGY